MPHFALLVHLRVAPDDVPAALDRTRAAAAAAVRDEEHCLRFDVAQEEGEPGSFYLFEVYRDAAALEHHYTTPHFRRFSEEVGPMILEKTRRRLTLH